MRDWISIGFVAKNKARIFFTRAVFSGLEEEITDPYGTLGLLQISQSSGSYQAL